MKKVLWGIFVAGLFALLLTPLAASAERVTIPSNGTWVQSALDDPANPDRLYYFKVDKPSKVTVSLRSYAYGPTIELYTENLRYVDHYSTISYGTPTAPQTQSLTNYLNPGTYIIEVSPYVTYTGRVDVSALVSPLSLGEVEPNDTKEKATALSNKKTYKAMLAEPYDVDFYSFTLTTGKYVDIHIYSEDPLYNYSVTDAKGNVYLKGSHWWDDGEKFDKTLYLSPGTYYLSMTYDYQGMLYELTCTMREPPSVQKISLPKTIKLTKGFEYTLDVTRTPKEALTPNLDWTSSKKSIATITGKGTIKALKTGKTTVTAKLGKLSAKTTVQVVNNEFTRSKPVSLKYKDIYTSTKKMYYKGDWLYVEIFVQNKTGRKVVDVDDLYLYFFDLAEDDEYPVYEKYVGRWKTTIKNNSYKVYKAKLPKSQFKNLDLASGRYQVIIAADFYVKGKGTARNRNSMWVPVLQ